MFCRISLLFLFGLFTLQGNVWAEQVKADTVYRKKKDKDKDKKKDKSKEGEESELAIVGREPPSRPTSYSLKNGLLNYKRGP